MEKNNMTAVEWLINKLQNRQNGIFDGFPHLSLDKIYDQAKRIEREQALQTFKAGQDSMEEGGMGFDQYYAATYGVH